MPDTISKLEKAAEGQYSTSSLLVYRRRLGVTRRRRHTSRIDKSTTSIQGVTKMPKHFYCYYAVTIVYFMLEPVMWCLEALPRLEAASRHNFHCLGLGLGLEPCCLGLGLGLD